MRKPHARLMSLLLLSAFLTGCTAAPAPLPALTLPPVASSFDAPIGDAGLHREVIVPLHLPALDGQHLLTFYETLNLPYDRHPAEAVLHALLAHPGNSRVQALGSEISLLGANPVEISGGVCTVNLSASALSLSMEALHTAAMSITATLCEMEDIRYVTLLIAGTPIAMDVTGHLPLGLLTAAPGQELPVLWKQLIARRTPIGELPAHTPLTSTAALYFPLKDGSGIAAEPRKLTFPGQHPQQMVVTLLTALSSGAETLPGAADMPDLSSLLLFVPEVSELESGGRRVTLHFTADVIRYIESASCDPVTVFAAVTTTLTTFVPALQQVCILVGNGALTSLYSDLHGSMLFPGALLTRSDFTHLLTDLAAVFIPEDKALSRRMCALPYRQARNPRALLLMLSRLSAIPQGLTDADMLGLSVANDTALVNLSARYAEVIRQSGIDQHLAAYAIVNTLCETLHVRRVRIYFGSEAVDHLDGSILWSGEFLYSPGLIGGTP